MKQVVLAVFLIAMASLTGCLNEDEPSDDTDSEDLIDPINAYEPPQISSIMVDYGYQGVLDCEWVSSDDGNGTSEEEVCEYIPCTKQGYQDVDGDGNSEYCDIDGHSNSGPQVIVTKIGNKVAIECIKSESGDNCKSNDYAYLIFTSIEGLQERIYCNMRDDWYDAGEYQYLFHTCEATLGFEPASFEISSSVHYFGYKTSYEPDYYSYVVFRVF